jgi:hypothetical protein
MRLPQALAAATTACLVLVAVGLVGFAAASTASNVRPKSTAAVAQTGSVDSIIDLVLRRNPDIRSYEAHAILDIRQVNFPYLHPVLDGHVYYTSPGYSVYDFPHTPGYLKGITRLEGSMGMASRWRQCYNITVERQPEAYILHMVPKILGEVSKMDVTVNKKSGDLEHFDWWYHDSDDNISLTQYYSMMDGYDVVTLQESDITRHHIRAKARGTFDSFQYNVPVPTPTPTPSDPLHQCDN